MTTNLWNVLHETADAVSAAFGAHQGEGYSGQRDTQYHLDVAADNAALAVLHGAGLRVVSEESGVTGSGPYTVVIDPIDGSTNCDRGLPFFNTSLAVLKDGELVMGLVVNQSSGVRYAAEVGAGATKDGQPIVTSSRADLQTAVVAFSGFPSHRLPWGQFRAFGAAALECCYVADGSIDAFFTAGGSHLNPWDYLAGLLIAREAGAAAGEQRDRRLEVDAAPDGRQPILAASPALLTSLQALRPF
jgi:fructose-1,6-bisphosphatase/inositol monophosphatase family enzyme